ncbi:DUF1684 domain-containing protein [Cellulomonas sp. NPDC089187]|uniref:DUF1684 domain-containing protein n=1 Tax=Cellulomonas sp. NPDC089187 TaxID=3154970 RepID=UPI003427F431
MTPLGQALDALAVADWRRQVAQLYGRVREIAAEDPAAAHRIWIDGRNELFAEHAASPLRPAAKAVFTGLDVAPYDPAYRFEVRVRATLPQRMEVATGTDGVVPFDRVAKVEVGDLGTLAVWALRTYGGGLFLPVKDATSNRSTYGGGRYLLDTVKGADLGRAIDGGLILDFNFAYNPSCAYDPAWACPLPSRGNVLSVPVPVGEQQVDPHLVADYELE